MTTSDNTFWILPTGTTPTVPALREALGRVPLELADAWWCTWTNAGTLLGWELLRLAHEQIHDQLPAVDRFRLWLALSGGAGSARLEELLLDGVAVLGGARKALTDVAWGFWATLWAQMPPDGGRGGVGDDGRGGGAEGERSGESVLAANLWEVVAKRSEGLEAAADILRYRIPYLSDEQLAALYPVVPDNVILLLVAAPEAGERLWQRIAEGSPEAFAVEGLLAGALNSSVRQSPEIRQWLLEVLPQETEVLEGLAVTLSSTDEGHAFWLEACRRAETMGLSCVPTTGQALALRPVSTETLSWLALSRDEDVRKWAQIELSFT